MSVMVGVFDRSPEQTMCLRDLAQKWHESDGFWGEGLTLDAAKRPGSVIVYGCEDKNVWQGAALVEVGPFDGELLYLYTTTDVRGTGLAKRLLQEVGSVLRERQNLASLFLEVRTSNAPAIALYESLHLERIGLRKQYYSNGEDAFVYRWRLR